MAHSIKDIIISKDMAHQYIFSHIITSMFMTHLHEAYIRSCMQLRGRCTGTLGVTGGTFVPALLFGTEARLVRRQNLTAVTGSRRVTTYMARAET